MIRYPKTVNADTDSLNLEFWFNPSNRGKIQHLHKELKAANEIDMGGWDCTTIWDMRHRNYQFEGFRVMRVLTDSEDRGWMGCYYAYAAGLVLEIQSTIDLSKIAAKYDCDVNDESIAVNGLHFHNHSISDRRYAGISCLGSSL